METPEIKIHSEYKYIYLVLKYVNILSHFLYGKTCSWCYSDPPPPVDMCVIIIQCVTLHRYITFCEIPPVCSLPAEEPKPSRDPFMFALRSPGAGESTFAM